MSRVNGLYGHIRHNDAKAALLIGMFVVLAWGATAALRFSVHAIVVGMELRTGEAVVEPGVDPLLLPLQNLRLMFTAVTGGDVGAKTAQHNTFGGTFSSTRRSEATDTGTKPKPGTFNSATPRKTGIAPHVPTTSEVVSEAWRRSRFFDTAALVVFLFSVIYLAQATWWNSLYIRYALRSRPLERRENPALYALVENLCITAGLPCPAIEVIDSPQLNAYASGLTPASARLGLTTGLIRTLDKDELEAVIAHELTHITNRDVRLMAITKACVDMLLPRYKKNVAERRKQIIAAALTLTFAVVVGLIPLAILVALLAVSLGVPAMAYLVKALILHTREFVADAGAIELTKNPAALISALRKIERGGGEPLSASLATQAMMISGPAGGLFSTHPTIDARIAAIREHGNLGAVDVRAARSRIVAPLAQPAVLGAEVLGAETLRAGPKAGPQLAFGRRVHGLTRSTSTGSVPAFAARPADTFVVASRQRAVWGTDAVFQAQPSAAASVSSDQGLGERLFRGWIMSGRLERAKDKVQDTVQGGARKIGRAYLYFNLAMLGIFVVARLLFH